MAGGGTFCLLLLDSLIRRVVVPLSLVTAVLFRYNVVSLTYLLFLLASFLLPSTRNSTHSVFPLVHECLLVGVSLVATLMQVLFQITLATQYSNSFEPCTYTERSWRQGGFILFGSGNHTLYSGPPVADVLRNFFIDLGMFAVSLSALIVTAVTVAQLRKQPKSPVQQASVQSHGSEETNLSTSPEPAANEELRSVSHSDEEEERPASISTTSAKSHSASVQQPFIQVPPDLLFLLEVAFVFFLVLSASAVPSLLAAVYMLVFLLLALVWSLHVDVPILKFAIWIVTMALVGMHLVVLYVFQLQSVQEKVSNSSYSLALRLSGMTPVIVTNCSQPTELRLSDEAIYTWYLNPIFLLLLFATNALNIRLRVFKPKVSWNSQNIVFFPSFTPRFWSSHSSPASDKGNTARGPATATDGYTIPTSGPTVERGTKKKSVWLQLLLLVREIGLATSFGLALVSMMVWSIAFPSWLSLILLLWACCIWLIPFLNAKWALLYTSPFLILFSVVLFLLEYMSILDLRSSKPSQRLQEIRNQSVLALPHDRLTQFPLLFLQFVLLASFFLALYTLVGHIKQRRLRKRGGRFGHRAHEESPDVGTPPPLERQITLVSTMEVVNNIIERLRKYATYYWVLVTMAAFLLAALVGPPSLFKAVYMFGFVLSLLIYQVLGHYWYRVCVPIWALFILYSFCELTVIYIYQFPPVFNALNFTVNSQDNPDGLLVSIGFPYVIPQVGLRFEDLLGILLPPTLFIAIMASQLRYFSPRITNGMEDDISLEAAGEDAMSLLQSAHHSLHQKTTQWARKKQTTADVQVTGHSDATGKSSSKVGQPKAADSGGSSALFGPAEESEEGPAPSKWEKVKQSTSEIARFVGQQLWQWTLELNLLFWRLMEIHLHKIIVLVMFVIVISQLGAILMVVLIMMILTTPVRQLNFLFYPVFTVVIGCIVILKMIYQIPIITPDLFDLSRNNCDPLNVTAYASSLTGPVIQYTFSPRGNDSNWFGLHKLGDSFGVYIMGYIAVLMLLAFWFVVHRKMTRHRTDRGGAVFREEKGALFPGVTRLEAEQSLWNFLKYSVNHAFDYVGTEICCCLLAITMAVRSDVYSVIYGIILGLCLLLTFAPRAAVILLWPFLTYAVGGLIVLQYAFLLGAPDGACFRPNSTTQLDYPWTADPVMTVQLRKWLFLSDYADILNRDYLYADFITFIAMCLKTFRIFRGAGVALNLTVGDDWDGTLKGYWRARKTLVTVQNILFGNWFWLCLLFLFFTGAVNASVWGYLYLLMSFAMSWWGRRMLAAELRTLRLSWEVVRAIVWLLMVIRAALQALGCAVQESDKNNCLLRLVLRARCSQMEYYFKQNDFPECGSEAVVGLALDAVLFAVITIQILIIQTHPFGKFQVAHRRMLAKAHLGARFFDDFVKQRLISTINEERAQVQAVKARLSLLQAHQGKQLAHKMHAGVRIPKGIKILKSRQSSTATSGASTPLLDRPPLQSPILGQTLQTKSKVGTASNQGLWHIIKSYITDAYTIFLEWLEQQSEVYHCVQEGLERAVTPEGDDDAPERTVPKEDQEGGDVSAGESNLLGGTVAAVERGEGATADSGGTPGPGVAKGEDMVDSMVPWIVSSAERQKADEELVNEGPKLEAAGDTAMHASFEFTDSSDVRERRKAYARGDSVNELLDDVETISSKIARLIRAIYYFLIANTAYVCFFFVIMNIIFNGSVLSLVYAIILFYWGLLTIPYPTQRFWLAMIFYTMLVVLVKYGFQFREFTLEQLSVLEMTSGLPVLQVLGIQKADNFLSIAVWDILLLLSLILHRALLKESGLWRKNSLRYAVISEIRDEVEEADKRLSSSEELSDDHEGERDGEVAPVRPPEEDPVVREVEESWQGIDEVVNLESITIWNKTKLTLQRGLYGVYRFYVKAVNPNITFGARDFYVLSVLLDSICFCLFVLGFSSFGLGEGEVEQVATYVQQNTIPIPFLVVLLLQFLSMLTDRIIYLRKSLPMKFLFNVFLIIAWHAYLFFILPYYTQRPFLDNKFAQAMYFFKAWYFVVSSFQITSGYPHRVLGYFWGKSSNLISGAILLVYRFIPIIPLLREVTDWTMTRTSLRLKHYLTVQEIWAHLFLLSANRRWERESPRNLGQPSSILVRLLLGGGFILLLVLLLWGPLLIISLISTTNIPNPPVDFSIELSISGFPALLTLAAQRRRIETLQDGLFEELKNQYSRNLDASNQFNQGILQRDQFTRILMEGEGSLLWTITDPARYQLKDSLNSMGPLDLLFKWTIIRNPPNGLVAERVQGRNVINLNPDLRQELSKALDGSGKRTSTLIPDLFPRIMTGPANGMSNNKTILNDFDDGTAGLVTCQLVHTTAKNGEFWSLRQLPNITNSRHLLNSSSHSTGLEFIVFSERVSLPEFKLLVGTGIIGLYTAVVLVIANFLRGYMSSLFYQVPYDEIPNPDYLLDLCQDIFIARECGELVMEEVLTGHLVYILRSNVKLLEWTKPKQD